MRHLRLASLVVLSFVGLTSSQAAAQTITRITPEAAAPGDLLLITGTNLAGVTIVKFGASVGGFAGYWQINVAPNQVGPTSVIVTVPTFGNFLPPGSFGSSPVGGVECLTPTTISNQLPFFYMEETAGKLTTPGLGTTQGGIIGRPVVGFKLANGAPNAGNSLFTLTLENATPGAGAMLAVGMPGVNPLTPYLDGFVGINLAQPYVIAQPTFIVNASGDVNFNIPIPATPFNATFTVQWIVVDPVTSAIGISNGLSVQL
jgi:hypothetical protein